MTQLNIPGAQLLSEEQRKDLQAPKIVQPRNLFQSTPAQVSTPAQDPGQERMSRMVQPQVESLPPTQSPDVVQFAEGKKFANANPQKQPVGVSIAQPVTPKFRQPSLSLPIIDPQSSIDGIDALSSLYTSPEEEARQKNASLQRQRIMAVGDALRHIGNIYNAVNYSPVQQFNNPVAEERQRYKEDKAIRDSNNMRYLTFQQAREQQAARKAQLEAQTKYQNESLALRKRDQKRLFDAQELAKRKQDSYERIKAEELALKNKLAEGKISTDEYNARSRRLSAEAAWLRAEKYQPGGANGGVGGYTTTSDTQILYDENGNRIGSKTTKTRTANGDTRTKTDLKLNGAKSNSGSGKGGNGNKNLGLKK